MTQYRAVSDDEMETGIDTPAAATFLAFKDNARAIAESDPSVPLASRINLDLAHTGPAAAAGQFLVVSKDGASWKRPDLADRFISAEFTASGSYVVPVAGRYRLRVWGGCAGGYRRSAAGGQDYPGGMGGYVEAYARLTAGQVLEITVGAGGAGVATADTPAGAGSYSRIVLPLVFELRGGGGESWQPTFYANPTADNVLTGAGYDLVMNGLGGGFAFAGYGPQGGYGLNSPGDSGRVIIERF